MMDRRDVEYYTDMAAKGSEYGPNPPVENLIAAVKRANAVLDDLMDRGYKAPRLRTEGEAAAAAIEEDFALRLDAWKADNEQAIVDEREKYDREQTANADKKMLKFRRMEASYNALTDDEIENKAQGYTDGAQNLSPDELNLLLGRLRKAKNTGVFKLLKSKIEERNGLRPWLNTERGASALKNRELYEGLQYGAFRYRIGDEPKQIQELKIKDLIKK